MFRKVDMADRVKFNANAFECAHGDPARSLADYANTSNAILESIASFKKSDTAAFIYIEIEGEYIKYRVISEKPNEGFNSSWLLAHNKNLYRDIGGLSLIAWLPDMLREPRGPYSVYHITVQSEGISAELNNDIASNYGDLFMANPICPAKFGAVSTDNNMSYIGITKQGIHKRVMQHVREAKNHRRYLLHRFLGKQQDSQTYTGVLNRVLRTGLSFEEAMQAEEDLVYSATLFPRGLNMIPGGHEGLRFLAKRNFHTNAKAMNKDKARVVTDFFKRNPNNPLLALRLQSDDELISRIVCKNPRNFDVTEVRQIRAMAELGWTYSRVA